MSQFDMSDRHTPIETSLAALFSLLVIICCSIPGTEKKKNYTILTLSIFLSNKIVLSLVWCCMPVVLRQLSGAKVEGAQEVQD